METKKLVKLIKGTVKTNGLLPVLENVKIEDNILTVSDLNVTLEIHLNSNGHIKGKGLIFYEDFISAIETIKDYKIEIKDKARIFNDIESVELALDKTDDYVKKPDVSKSKRIGVIDNKDFEKILIAQNFVKKKDDFREELEKVYIGKDIVATNAHFMYFEKASQPPENSYLLPPKVVKLMKIIGDNSIKEFIKLNYSAIIVYANKEFIRLSYSDAEIIFKIPKGWNDVNEKFPDYKKVIPKKHLTKVKVDKKEFADRITKAVKFVAETPHKIRTVINKKLSINSFDVINGTSYNSDIPINKTGKNVISEFNGKLMLRILKNIKDEKVTLKFTGANKVILIQDNFILMPIMQTAY